MLLTRRVNSTRLQFRRNSGLAKPVKRFNIFEQNKTIIDKNPGNKIYLGIGINKKGFAIKIGKEITNINLLEKLFVGAAYLVCFGMAGFAVFGIVAVSGTLPY